MTWATLILLILKYLGPPLAAVLREWLERRLNEAASTLPPLDVDRPLRPQVTKLFIAARPRLIGPFRRRLLGFAYRTTWDRIDPEFNRLDPYPMTKTERASFDHMLVGANDHPEENINEQQ